MQVRSELKLLFTGLVTQYPGTGKVFDSLWKEILDAYSAPNRRYHNLDHLHYIVSRLNECPVKPVNVEAIHFSLFYHDLVYEVPNRDNEGKSAEIARQRMKTLGVKENSINLCVKHILATKKHRQSDNADTNLFCDADIAILGDSADNYRQYAAKVRDEFRTLSDEEFTRGRKKELEKILSMPRIYKTPYFFETFEISARNNIGEEIRRLSQVQ